MEYQLIMAPVFRAVNEMRVRGRGLSSNSGVFVLAICCLLGSPTHARAQLWDTPSLPPVTYSAASDGMTLSVGSEQVHISVCRSGVIHFVANPEPSNAIRPNQPWMLD